MVARRYNSTSMLLVSALALFALLRSCDAWKISKHSLPKISKAVSPAAVLGTVIALQGNAVLDGGFSRFSASNSIVPAAHAAELKQSVFVGSYLDPFHPDGYRKLTVDGNLVTLAGADSKGGKQWILNAVENPPGTMLVDFSPKGGPKDLKGVFNKEKNAIQWPDGNSWTKIAPLP